MAPRTKALLVLVLTAPVLTEIVSGNTPIHRFLDPRVPIFFLVAYSLPLVVIREAAFRWRISMAGVFLLGLAYGIWNEGLLAQTLIRFDHVPINRFDRYIYAAGFNFSWTVVIVPWHAMLAIIFPIALVSALFPGVESDDWVGRRQFLLLSFLWIALVTFVGIARKPHAQMIACAAAIFLLMFSSFFLRRRSNIETRRTGTGLPFVTGILAYIGFIIPSILLAGNHVLPPLYFGAVLSIVGAFWILGWYLRLYPQLARVGLGAYVAASGFNLLAGIAQHSVERILTGAVLAIIFCAIQIRGLRQVPEVSGMASVAAKYETVSQYEVDQ